MTAQAVVFGQHGATPARKPESPFPTTLLRNTVGPGKSHQHAFRNLRLILGSANDLADLPR